MSTVNPDSQEPSEDADQPRAPEDQPAATRDQPHEPTARVPQRLMFASVPALLTSVLLSLILFIAVLYFWYAIGPEIRSQVTWPQALTLLTIALAMVAIMLSVGYSRLWADERGITIRNGPVLRKFPIEEVAGLRLRDGDPWAYLLVKDDKGGVRRRAVLAIQQLEGARGKRKVRQLRLWLKANGATSAGIALTED